MLVFFDRIKICLVFGFYGCNFIGIDLVSICHFPQNGISSKYPLGSTSEDSVRIRACSDYDVTPTLAVTLEPVRRIKAVRSDLQATS